MAINQNNFLRWLGSSNRATYSWTSTGDYGFNLYANEDFCVVQPLIGLTASLGINAASFQIISILDIITGLPVPLSQDCEWDGISNLTVYRPLSSYTGVGFNINFSIQDNSENFCPNPVDGYSVSCIIDMSSIVTEWITYSISAVCTLDQFGNNTGYQNFTQLILVNSATLTPIAPLTLKDNLPSDPDYVLPQLSLTSCPPPPGAGLGKSNLIISNFSLNNADSNPDNYIIILGITLSSSSFGYPYPSPLTLNYTFPNPLMPGNSITIYTIAGTWDNISITYQTAIGGHITTASPTRYWKTNSAGAIAGFGSGGLAVNANPVTDGGSPYAGNPGITIPANPAGITIFVS